MSAAQQQASAVAVRRPLTSAEAVRTLLDPRAVALVGASADDAKFSGQPLRNLLRSGYRGDVHVVNRRGGTVLDRPALTSVESVPAGVDVGLVLVPAAQCAPAVEGLGRAGVPVAVVAVSGFAEMGTAEGDALQQELAEAGRSAGVRVLGPNCNGVYNTSASMPLGYNYTHSQLLSPGRIGLVSHSGAMLGGFVPLIERCGQSLSAFVSTGNEVDLGLLDVMEYLVDDEATRVIALILDGVADGQRFRTLLRRARERGKAVVALKLGNSEQGVGATQAHSSRLAGTRSAYEAVFRDEGVVDVPTLETLAFTSAVLADGRSPQHDGVVATSTSGAGGILMADALSSVGLAPPPMSSSTVQRMAPASGFAQVRNPFDIGAAGRDRIADNLRALVADPGAGTLLVYLTPVPTAAWRLALAQAVAEVTAEARTVPVLVVSPAPLADDEEKTYREGRVPVLGSLLDAVATISSLSASVPRHTDEDTGAGGDPGGSGSGPEAARTAMSEYDSMRLLAEHGIAFPRETLTHGLDEALAAAADIGYPVVLKAVSAQFTHKSDDRLLVLDVTDATALERAYAELEQRARQRDPDGFQGVLLAEQVGAGLDVMLGLHVDPDFGPLLVVGAGGVLTELVADVAMTPLPLEHAAAERLLRRTKVSRLLAGYRGGPTYDLDGLVAQMLTLAAAAGGLGDDLAAVDLNPVRVLPESGGAVALDALVVRSMP